MRRLPSLTALKAFEAAARLGGLSPAAAELNVTHSAISQHIRTLEDYFGLKLFVREGRALKPAPQAQAYLQDVRASFDRLAMASDQLIERARGRIIRVNVTPSFAMRWLIPRLSAFQIAHPRTEVRVTTSAFDTIEQLDSGFDVIVRRDKMMRDGHECRRFLDDISTAVASPELVGLQGVKEPADLVKLPLMHLKSRPDGWVRWFRAAGLPITDTLSGQFYDHFFLSIQAAINRLGVALAPQILIDDDVRQNRLMLPMPQISIEGPGFFVLFAKDRPRDRELSDFIDWLTDEAPALSQ